MAQYTSISSISKLLLLVLVFGFFAYILGPPLKWQVVRDGLGMGGNCSPCLTECPEAVATADLHNVTLSACPKVADELQKSQYQNLQEEMKLQKKVAQESQLKADGALLKAKKAASQIQKDFDKCNSSMETSERAREKAEAALAAEKKKAAMWEARSKELGWKGDEETKTEEVAEEKDTTKPTDNPIPVSKNGPKVMKELQENLGIQRFLFQRAVENEMRGVKVAREHAAKLNLL